MEKLSLTGKSKHSVDDQMRGLSALFVDGEKVFIDNGAIHAKSELERGITWVRDRSEVANGREVLGLWITLHRFAHGQGYYGAMPFTLMIDEAAKTGFKNLSQQVNYMDKAVRGTVDLSTVDVATRQRIKAFLQSIREDLWNNAQDSFKSAFEQEETGES
jgi:hypothetical protein